MSAHAVGSSRQPFGGDLRNQMPGAVVAPRSAIPVKHLNPKRRSLPFPRRTLPFLAEPSCCRGRLRGHQAFQLAPLS